MSDSSKKVGLSWTGLFGILLTIGWIAYVVNEVVRRGGYQDLNLNALGDFLAGAGGPVVLLWIVIGYFQQSAALRLQQEELRAQVEETKNLVKQSTRQVDLIAEQNEFARQSRIDEAQPIFVMTHTGESITNIQTTLTNHGAVATDLQVIGEGIIDGPRTTPNFPQSAKLSLALRKDDIIGGKLLIEYTDALGIVRHQNFIITNKYSLVKDWEEPGT